MESGPTLTAQPRRRQGDHAAPRVAVVDTQGRTRLVALRRGDTTVGRDGGCDVVLRDDAASRRHLVLHVSPHANVTVTDLGSHNGTRVDDVALGPYETVRLTPGAVVEVGEHLVKYVPDGAADSYLHLRVAGFSVRDPLTGLANRAGFDAALDAACALATHDGGGFALVLCDVDRFKAVNDEHGHTAGDAVLRGVAGVLRSCTRDTDVVCRFGGEELAVVLAAGADLAAAHRTAERLRRAVEEWTAPGGIRVTASFGVAAWSPRRATPDALVAVADKMLYAAKAAGRNRVVSDLTRR